MFFVKKPRYFDNIKSYSSTRKVSVPYPTMLETQANQFYCLFEVKRSEGLVATFSAEKAI